MPIQDQMEIGVSDASEELLLRVESACRKMPPLWPLRNFVAVNPFVGLSGLDFAEACRLIKTVSHDNLTTHRKVYAEAWEREDILPRDLLEAAALHGGTWTAEDLLKTLETDGDAEPLCRTFADTIDHATGSSWSSFVVEEVSKWCAAYYDDGQALWRMPWDSLPLFKAWKRGAELDRTPEVSGLPGFRAAICLLPDDALAAIESIVDRLGVPPEEQEVFFHRQLMTVRGWAGYVQYLVREKSLRGEADDSLAQILAIRLAYDFALRQAFGPYSGIGGKPGASSWVPGLTVWQDALEIAHRRTLYGRLQACGSGALGEERAAFQAVFCIDVRSEVFRRALESAAPDAETIGFAGFFGFPIEVVPLASAKGTARCPVLLLPSHRIKESAGCVHTAEERRAVRRRNDVSGGIWQSFKSASITCFPFVETLGLAYAGALVRNSLALSSAGPSPAEGYRIDGGKEADAKDGIPLCDRIQMAEGALRNMGLTKAFARLVLFCGHGSRTANNPFGSSLDCGACGGHTGEANARVAAAVLNEAPVRAALKEKGIVIPDDTVFVAGLHNTTTDRVELFDDFQIPDSHAGDWQRLRRALAAAGEIARGERSPALGLAGFSSARLRKAVEARSCNWAEVRPEWGLAGNHVFIAAPRCRTRDLNLNGRAFLHSYDWREDPESRTLELILCAPMVVANWINLQYFASASNNRLFGSGNKVLHNVVGKIGVLEGNGGDLKTGLPWQSVATGDGLAHLPLRLNVIVESPRERIEEVIGRHEDVRRLVDNHWLHLHAWEDDGRSLFHRISGQWRRVCLGKN